MLRSILAGLVAAVLSGAVAQAQTPADAIALRKAGMDLVIGNLGAAKRAIDAKEDVKPLKGSAQAIARWARIYPTLFVPGSDGGDSRMLPEATTDHAGVVAKADALAVAADKMVAAADANDKAAFAEAFTEAGAACGACHRAYRKN